MRKLLGFAALSAMFAFAVHAETYTGRLVDATCAMQGQNRYDQQDQGQQGQQGQQGKRGRPGTGMMASCAPTSSTTTFALDVSGKIYRLDDAGNSKVAEAIRGQADRQKDPSTTQANNAMVARITGTLEGNVIRVDSVQLQ